MTAKKAKVYKVDWSVQWAAPHGQKEPEGQIWEVGIEEAEKRLAAIARAAVHHAVVSGTSEIVIRVAKSNGAPWTRVGNEKRGKERKEAKNEKGWNSNSYVEIGGFEALST